MRSAESVAVGASLALAGTALLLPSAARGSGFQLQEQSASGLGVYACQCGQMLVWVWPLMRRLS